MIDLSTFQVSPLCAVNIELNLSANNIKRMWIHHFKQSEFFRHSISRDIIYGDRIREVGMVKDGSIPVGGWGKIKV